MPELKGRALLGLGLRGVGMALLLGIFVASVDWAEAGEALRGLRVAWLAPMMGCYAAGQVANGLGWRHLTRSAGLEVGFVEMIRHDLAAVFWSTVLPGSIAGEFIKGVRVAGSVDEAETTAVALLSARLVGGATAGALGLALWPFAAMPEPYRQGVGLALAGLVALGVGGVVALQLGPAAFRRLLPRVAERLPEGRRPRLRELAVCVAASTLAHACFSGLFACYFAAVGAPVSYADAALIGVATTAAQALPVTLGGFGVRELTMGALGATLVPAASAAAASVLGTLSFAVPVTLGGLSEWLLPVRRRVG